MGTNEIDDSTSRAGLQVGFLERNKYLCSFFINAYNRTPRHNLPIQILVFCCEMSLPHDR
jgi:hypothetical protein